MKPEAIFEYLSVNGELESVEETQVFNGLTGAAIYEVIRVVKGNPMFLEDHLERMYNSATISEQSIGYDKDQIRSQVMRLIAGNDIENNNIKLLATKDQRDDDVFLIYAVESFYPPSSYYSQGIKTILFNHQRNNPNAKVQYSDFRQRIKSEMDEKNAFEALLVNDEGFILEGSRSNMFYIMDGKIYTAPASDVLLGITRKHIIALSMKLGYPIIEKRLHKDQLENIQGLFISGTSIGILPVSWINDTSIPTVDSKIIEELLEGYKNLMEAVS